MAYKFIKYVLNSNGTIPSFVYGPLSGQMPNKDSDRESPADTWLVGVANDGASLPSGQAEEITSKDNLISYLNSYTSEWKVPSDPNDDLSEEVPLNQETVADRLWSQFSALNE